jgi:hypothetical protein
MSPLHSFVLCSFPHFPHRGFRIGDYSNSVRNFAIYAFLNSLPPIFILLVLERFCNEDKYSKKNIKDQETQYDFIKKHDYIY